MGLMGTKMKYRAKTWLSDSVCQSCLTDVSLFEFLADCTNGCAVGTVLRPSVVVCLYGMYCG